LSIQILNYSKRSLDKIGKLDIGTIVGLLIAIFGIIVTPSVPQLTLAAVIAIILITIILIIIFALVDIYQNMAGKIHILETSNNVAKKEIFELKEGF
jgi:uncharacterized protein YacL